MAAHELKCWPEYFERIWDNSKHFELRKDDRGFQEGDTLVLREWLPETNEYTGRQETVRVLYVLRHNPEAGCAATFGLTPGYVIMSI